MNQAGFFTFRTIGIDLAREMLDIAVAAVGTDMNVSGFAVIYSSTGMQLCSQAVGPNAKPMNAQIALAKIETVLNRRESSGILQEKIKAKGTRPENYAGAVKTLFGGGLAIFADKECTEFVGAIAFSGGEEWQDMNLPVVNGGVSRKRDTTGSFGGEAAEGKICQAAIESVELYTDQIR